MNFKDKIKEIFSGLTGDNEKDIAYLHEQMEKYRGDENSTEIARAVGRKIFELLPDDTKTDINKIIGNDLDTVNSTMEEAKFQLSKHNPKKAEQLFRSVIDSIPFEFKEDDECGYFCFDHPLETAIFAVSEEYEKTIRRPTYNFSEIYYMYAYSLIENGKLDDAEAALKEALKWNPVSTTIMSELSEIYKLKKDYDNYLYWSKKIISYATSSTILARGYRNIAYYYCDIEEYEKSAAIYYFSRAFEDCNQVTSELFYISEKLGKLPPAPSPKDIDKLFKQENIPYGASDFVVGTAYQLSKSCLDNNDPHSALFYLSVVYDLTNDGSIHKMIENIQNDIGAADDED